MGRAVWFFYVTDTTEVTEKSDWLIVVVKEPV